MIVRGGGQSAGGTFLESRFAPAHHNSWRGPLAPPPSHISKTLLRLPSTQAHLGRLGSVPRAAVAQPLVDPPDLSLLYPNRPPTSIGFWQASESGPHSGLGKEEGGSRTMDSRRRTEGSYP